MRQRSPGTNLSSKRRIKVIFVSSTFIKQLLCALIRIDMLFYYRFFFFFFLQNAVSSGYDKVNESCSVSLFLLIYELETIVKSLRKPVSFSIFSLFFFFLLSQSSKITPLRRLELFLSIWIQNNISDPVCCDISRGTIVKNW